MLLQANDYAVAPRARGLRAADRRLGPVGQHPLGRRPDPAPVRRRPCTPCAGPCSRRRRHEAGQDHRGPRLARPRAHLARTRFFQHWMQHRRRRRAAGCWPSSPSLPMDEVDALVAAARRRPGAPGGPAAPGPGGHRAGPRPRAGRRRPRRPPASSSGATRDGLRGRWPPWPREVPGTGLEAGEASRPAWSSAGRWCEPAWPPRRARPGRQLDQGGVVVNGDKAERRRGSWRPPTCSRPLGPAAQGQARLGRRRRG